MKNYKTFFESYYIKASEEPFDGGVEISDSEYRDIKHVFSSTDQRAEIDDFLTNTVKLSRSHVDLARKLILSDDAAVNYIKTREQDGVTIEELIKAGNYVEPFIQRGISRDTINRIYNTTPQALPSIGRGELLLQLFVRGATTAFPGDIAFYGDTYDIKGDGARLGGQHGFAGGIGASTKWNKIFTQHQSHLPASAEIPEAGSTGYNILKGKLPFQFEAALQLQQSMDPAEFAQSFPGGITDILLVPLQRVFVKADRNTFPSIDNFFDTTLKAGGVTAPDSVKLQAYATFLKEFAVDALNYYLELENLTQTGLIAVSDRGTLLLVKYNDSELTDRINITYPSFSLRASSGAITAITIKHTRGYSLFK